MAHTGTKKASNANAINNKENVNPDSSSHCDWTAEDNRILVRELLIQKEHGATSGAGFKTPV